MGIISFDPPVNPMMEETYNCLLKKGETVAEKLSWSRLISIRSETRTQSGKCPHSNALKFVPKSVGIRKMLISTLSNEPWNLSRYFWNSCY